MCMYVCVCAHAYTHLLNICLTQITRVSTLLCIKWVMILFFLFVDIKTQRSLKYKIINGGESYLVI